MASHLTLTIRTEIRVDDIVTQVLVVPLSVVVLAELTLLVLDSD